MGKIKNIVFDLGGVIIDLDRDEPVRRLIEIGVKDADGLIDPYEQKGVFQDLETGKIGVEEFCRYLRKYTGKDLSYEDICWAWFGFIGGVPQYKLDYILKLREKYQVYLLSNTNPIIQLEWAQTKEFTPAGRPLNDYFDKLYLSVITVCDKGNLLKSPLIVKFLIAWSWIQESDQRKHYL